MKRPSVILLLALPVLVRFAVSAEETHPPHGQEEPLDPGDYPRKVTTAAHFKELPLNDPELRKAYLWLLRTANSGGPVADKRLPEMLEVLKDAQRRGDSATPLWLDIMAKNHNTSFETYGPGTIARIGTVKMEPYVEYFRKMIQTRPDEIDFSTAEAMLEIFFVYGTKEDVKMVEALARRGPIMASAIQSASEREQRRTAPRTKPSEPATTPAPTPAVEPQAPEKAPGTNPAPTTRSEGTSTTPWSVVTVVAIAAALGLLWLLIKRRS